MKEYRFTQHDLLEVPREPFLGEFYLRNKLKSAGFDLSKEIKFHEDIAKSEYVYTQED
jgi:hypothetical protein